ncbi:MAG: RNA polymerase subunit sigma-24 [Actinobacteria bacterium HGW-Actinobacteria-4]|nr:MAG: RNA polymerase subunit sigma-24 [Actinobacteria bacterium HGW-Actinobacteria-4]
MSEWRELIDEVARTRHGSLVGYGVLLTASRPAAEDLVQDAMVKVFSRVRTVPNAAAADQYIRRAMLTIFLDQTRRNSNWRRLRPVIATADAVAGHADAVANAQDVREALAALSPRERACVVLRHFDDLTVPQIAERTGLAAGTVKRYLSDGMKKMGAELAPEEHEEHLEHIQVSVVEVRSRS